MSSPSNLQIHKLSHCDSSITRTGPHRPFSIVAKDGGLRGCPSLQPSARSDKLSPKMLRRLSPSRLLLESTRAVSTEGHGRLVAVQQRLADAARLAGAPTPRIVAVSKTKPPLAVRAAYDVGQRDFGENYVDELCGKWPHLPEDTRWRFVGKLALDQVDTLVSQCPALVCVETVDSRELADRLQRATEGSGPRAAPLGIFIQVKTSKTNANASFYEGGSGVSAAAAPDLAAHVAAACPGLKLHGLMTMRAPSDMSVFPKFRTLGEESCFAALQACRRAVAARLAVREDELELSMGMTSDMEEAVAAGSNSVRLGSSVFGAREWPVSAQ